MSRTQPMDAERVKVERFIPRLTERLFNGVAVQMIPSENGNYVLYSAYAAVAERLATLERAASGGGEAVGTVVAQAPSMATIVAVAIAAGAELESNSETPDMSDVGEPWATFTGAQLFEFVDRILQIAPQPAVPEGWRDDVRLAVEMMTWGFGDDGGLSDKQSDEIRAQQRKVLAMLAAAPKGVGRE